MARDRKLHFDLFMPIIIFIVNSQVRTYNFGNSSSWGSANDSSSSSSNTNDSFLLYTLIRTSIVCYLEVACCWSTAQCPKMKARSTPRRTNTIKYQ